MLFRSRLSLLDDASIEDMILAQGSSASTVRVSGDKALLIRAWTVFKADSMEEQRWVRLSCGCEGTEQSILTRSSEGTGREQRCKLHHERVSVVSEAIEELPVSGGLQDPTIWAPKPSSTQPQRHLGVIDLEKELAHPITGKPVRYVPVIPPHLRTKRIEQGYRQLLRWLARKKEKAASAPSSAENEGENRILKRLTESFDRLILDGFLGAVGGKTGFLRQRILGKRVDLSGRAVIVPDPGLELDACGVPFAVGLDLAADVVQQRIREAIRESMPPAHELAATLISSLVELPNEESLETWLAEHGVATAQLARSLGLAGRLREGLSASVVASDPLAGGQSTIRRARRRTGGRHNLRLEDVARAIDRARPSSEQLVAGLIRRVKEGLHFKMDEWAQPSGLNMARFCEAAGFEDGESITTWLARVCQQHCDSSEVIVILNRAPSLHRYNMHAFRPKVRTDEVIALHPALCGRYNADFDGDTMALHVPVQQAVRQRVYALMRPSASLRSSAAGQPLIHKIGRAHV